MGGGGWRQARLVALTTCLQKSEGSTGKGTFTSGPAPAAPTGACTPNTVQLPGSVVADPIAATLIRLLHLQDFNV